MIFSAYQKESARSLSRSESKTTGMMEILAVAGIVALCAQVRVPLPMTPVPVTLQTLVVLAAPFAVGPTRATAGMLLYTALGLLGAPLFAVSFGPTFGYIVGFAVAAAVVTRFRMPSVGILAGLAAIYGLGVAWLCLWTGGSLWTALAMGVAPFLPGEALKAALAYRFARWTARQE